MNCPKCGKENPDGAQSCSSCSAALSVSAKTAEPIIPKTSNIAVASLILGILGPLVIFITPIPATIAVILGIVALVKISKSSGQLKGKGLAIAGISIPSATMFLIGFLAPGLAMNRQTFFRSVCGENLSRLGKGMLLYANDYDDKYPIPSKWCDLMLEYADADLVQKNFCCKGVPQGPCNYAMNKNLEGLSILDISDPIEDTVLLFECKPGWNQSGGAEILTTENHQGDGCNIVFVDCRVEFVRTKDLDKLKWIAKKNP